MNLKFQSASPEVKAAFSQGLAEAGASYLPTTYSPQHDYHVVAYSLSLKHLAPLPEGAGIDNVVKPTGWQCFGTCDSDPETKAVLAEVTPHFKAPRQSGQFAGPMRMTSLLYGEVVNTGYQKTLEMHQRATDPNFAVQGSYEPRVLRIPGLLITAFWMKSIDNPQQPDLIIPIHHKLPVLEEQPYYSLSGFLEKVQPLAKERLSNPVLEEPSA